MIKRRNRFDFALEETLKIFSRFCSWICRSIGTNNFKRYLTGPYRKRMFLVKGGWRYLLGASSLSESLFFRFGRFHIHGFRALS